MFYTGDHKQHSVAVNSAALGKTHNPHKLVEAEPEGRQHTPLDFIGLI